MFLKCIAFEQCNFNLDWAITILFYCAVDLVEIGFAKKGMHSNSHWERDKKIITDKEFDKICDEFFALKRASMKYRYHCPKKPDRLYHKDLCSSLEKIEQMYKEVV